MTKTSNNHEKPDFVFKHRITGAAVLLFIGALLLPWLLGAPSQASKTQIESDLVTSSGSEKFEEDLRTAIAAEQNSEQEQVYVSKITPLDSKLKPSVVEAAATREEPSDSANESRTIDEPNAGQTTSGDTDKPTVVAVAKTDEANLPESNDLQARDSGEFAAVGNAVKSVDNPGAKIDVGWAVQIGVFTDKQGAARVVQDLQDKGFKPSTSIVDTNRGKATGTRIWLGPFAQRVDAAKAKTQLTSKTGEAGFIRAYP